MKKRYVKRDYSMYHPLEVYNLVRRGDLKKFPNNYLDKSVVKIIVRHVVLVEMKFTRKDIIKNVDYPFMARNYMGGFRKLFDTKMYYLIDYCFPEMEIKAWELAKVTPGFWENEENIRAFLIWVMEKEGIDPNSKKDLRRLTAAVIRKHGGGKLLKTEPDVYAILNIVVCDRFKEWEIMKLRAWDKEKAIAAIKWLVEEKMGYTLEEACELKSDDFRRNNLDGLLQKCCNHSVIEALNLAYGDCFVRESAKKIRLVTASN